MIIKTKIVKTKYKFAFTLSFLIACASVLEGKEVYKGSSKYRGHPFIYPSDVIDYSISGSTLIEFNLNSDGEVENLSILESLGISFDRSIIDGLGQFSKRGYFKK